MIDRFIGFLFIVLRGLLIGDAPEVLAEPPTPPMRAGLSSRDRLTPKEPMSIAPPAMNGFGSFISGMGMLASSDG